MIAVYVASPYTLVPNKTMAVDIQMDAGNRLMDLGFHPFLPLLSHFWDQKYTRTYRDWMSLDLTFLERCDCVLRLPGKSHGADREVQHARQNDIPVFFHIDDLILHYGAQS